MKLEGLVLGRPSLIDVLEHRDCLIPISSSLANFMQNLILICGTFSTIYYLELSTLTGSIGLIYSWKKDAIVWCSLYHVEIVFK